MTEEEQEEVESIRLDQFLKFAELVGSGGQAKHIIQGGEVLVNGEVETRRGRKLYHGDIVEFESDEYPIEFGDESSVD
jgi:ribosome-associated protein